MIEIETRQEPLPVVVAVPDTKPEAPDVPTTGAHRASRRGLSTSTTLVLWVVLAVGLLSLWLVSYARVFSGVEESASQRGLYDSFREQLAAATAPVGGVITPGAPVALIDAPAAGIDDQIVVEGTTSDIMRDGPGHRRNSSLPGQAGSSVIYGRSVAFGGPFGEISQLTSGDTISVTTGQGQFAYTVEGVRRPGDPLPVPLQEGESRLILVSSESSGYLKGWAAQTPVYVDARLEGDVSDTPPGRPLQVGDPEEVMGASTGSLMPLVLWLQLLLVVSVMWVWAARRWNAGKAWLVTVPVFVAALWGATGAAFGLLPNLL